MRIKSFVYGIFLDAHCSDGCQFVHIFLPFWIQTKNGVGQWTVTCCILCKSRLSCGNKSVKINHDIEHIMIKMKSLISRRHIGQQITFVALKICSINQWKRVQSSAVSNTLFVFFIDREKRMTNTHVAWRKEKKNLKNGVQVVRKMVIDNSEHKQMPHAPPRAIRGKMSQYLTKR